MKPGIRNANVGQRVRMWRNEEFRRHGAGVLFSRRTGGLYGRIFGRPRRESPLQEMPSRTISKIQGRC